MRVKNVETVSSKIGRIPAGSLTQPIGRVSIALSAGLLEGKKLACIASDGTQTELSFEAKDGMILFTLDFANSELPVMLFRLVPLTTAP